MNPAQKAQQHRKDEVKLLQEECSKLRELVKILEKGSPVPVQLEAGESSQSSTQGVAGK